MGDIRVWPLACSGAGGRFAGHGSGWLGGAEVLEHRAWQCTSPSCRREYQQ
jgi:hypothetical protein